MKTKRLYIDDSVLDSYKKIFKEDKKNNGEICDSIKKLYENSVVLKRKEYKHTVICNGEYIMEYEISKDEVIITSLLTISDHNSKQTKKGQ
jgi:hypothetical protein